MKTDLNNDSYYKIYAQEIQGQLDIINNKIRDYKKSLGYFISQLEPYRETIDKYCDFEFDKIVKSRTVETLDQYKLCVFSLTGRVKTTYEDAVKITRSIIACNKLIKRFEDKLAVLSKKIVPVKGFKAFIKSFNLLIREAILYRGYEFDFGAGVSSIYVQRKKRYIKDDKAEGLTTVHNTKSVNWGASNVKKKEILERGGTPYKAIKDADFNVIGDNGGEKWFVYVQEEYSYWIAWMKMSCRVVNKLLYSFNPARDFIVEMQQARTNDLIVANYIVG